MINSILKTLFDNVNPLILIVGAVAIAIWFVSKNPLGNFLDKIGGNGANATNWLWPVGITITAITLALIFKAPDTFAKMTDPAINIATTDANAYKFSQTSPTVYNERLARDAKAYEADKAQEVARENAHAGTGDPVLALAPVWQVLRAETDKLLAPTQKFETVKTDTQTNYEAVKDPITGVVALVPTGQIEQRNTTTRTSDPLTLVIILGIVSAVAGAWGRKS